MQFYAYHGCFKEEQVIGTHFAVDLSVETDNQPALALYTKTGFRILHTFQEGAYHRHRMEYRLGGCV